jgi:hypothetical protein
MITAYKYKDVILNEFYLDDDDITVRRAKDGYHGRYKKGDIVTPYIFKGNKGNDYKGVHIPRTRTTISYPWLLTILRQIPFNEDSVLDHINGDINDNSRSNLRVVTQKINTRNQRKRNNNKTGYTGIYYNVKNKIYIIRKQIRNKRIYRSSKSLVGAIVMLKELNTLALQDGYSVRHGK